ncbi:MAG TPA: ATP-binding protein [Acidobacteriota bacterium]|nr:ATP-binding protein [Acidobacteriota bacterium]
MKRWTAAAPLVTMLLTLAITSLLVYDHLAHHSELKRQLLLEKSARLDDTCEHVRGFFNGIHTVLSFISHDAGVTTSGFHSYPLVEDIAAGPLKRGELKGLYVLENQPDWTLRPLVPVGDSIHNGSEIADLGCVRSALEMQRSSFDRNPDLRGLLSDPVFRNVGPECVLYSVPVRSGGKLDGMIVGVVPTGSLAAELQSNDYRPSVLLAGEGGTIVSCGEGSEAMYDWFNSRFRQHGVASVFADRPAAFRIGSGMILWRTATLPSGQPLWLAVQYHESVLLEQGGYLHHWVIPIAGLATALVLALMAGLVLLRRGDTRRFVRERQCAEAQRQKLQQELERSRRMESVGLLAGGVAHDLNNMIGPLVAYPELILSELPDDSPVRRDLEIIGKSARRAAEVVQDLLAMARRGRYEMRPVNLNELVEEYLDSAGFRDQRSRHPAVAVNTPLDHSIANVMGSPAHLSKVVMNLVINAYDAMPDGGTLNISTGQAYLDRLQSGYDQIDKGEYVLLTVTDSGIGINPQDIPNVFEPYYSKKKMGRSGSGLGLAVVYGILKDHEGYYDVRSEVGTGSDFTMYFPITHVAADQAARAEARTGTESILVVDDVPEQLELTCRLLSGLGYVVEGVGTGREAAACVQRTPPDLVVLDMILEKDFDGLDAYREMAKYHPGQKAVVVSGFTATRRVQQLLAQCAGQFLEKPFTREMLGEAVRLELDRTCPEAVAPQDRGAVPDRQT